MQQTLTFSTPTELDLRLLTTFGANVKLGESPIGQFGTGLKYALAGILRLGGKIKISIGTDIYCFEPAEETIRGKKFLIPMMWREEETESPAPTALPFTLDLGRHWEPWMLYRELWSNTKDEDGTVSTAAVAAASGETHITVTCPELFSVHQNLEKYFLQDRKPFFTAGGVEFYHGSSSAVFYRGIRAATLEKSSLYTYNITKQMELTEDRTFASTFDMRYTLAQAIGRLSDNFAAEVVLTAAEDKFEHKLDYDYIYSPSEQMLATAARLVQKRQGELPTAIHKFVKTHVAPTAPKRRPATPEETEMLTNALRYCVALGYSILNPVAVADLAESTLGAIDEDTIIVAPAAFSCKQNLVCTLLEEQIHINSGAKDNTREMQEAFLEAIWQIGQKHLGDFV